MSTLEFANGKKYNKVGERPGKAKRHENVRLIQSCDDSTKWNIIYLVGNYDGRVMGQIRYSWVWENVTPEQMDENTATKMFIRKTK